MNTNRYRYHDEPITPEMARVARKAQIENELEEIQLRKAQIKECEDYIVTLRAKPLDTTIRVQITLRPGDDGYDEAPSVFDPTEYQGDFQWVNTPTT
jgi:protein-tyrosine-phosphatase